MKVWTVYYLPDLLYLHFQRTISDLEGKIYNANYSQKYLTENLQDLQTKLGDERYYVDILKDKVENL